MLTLSLLSIFVLACNQDEVASKHDTSLTLEEQIEILAQETGVEGLSFKEDRNGEPFSPREFEQVRSYLKKVAWFQSKFKNPMEDFNRRNQELNAMMDEALSRATSKRDSLEIYLQFPEIYTFQDSSILYRYDLIDKNDH